jgi:trimeric autotransporter adhesin
VGQSRAALSGFADPARAQHFEPRIGISWRPIPASTVVIRAGYGIYPDTSVYQGIVLQMAQQYPLSKSLSVQNSTACPLTLANGFVAPR